MSNYSLGFMGKLSEFQVDEDITLSCLTFNKCQSDTDTNPSYKKSSISELDYISKKINFASEDLASEKFDNIKIGGYCQETAAKENVFKPPINASVSEDVI